MKLLQLTQQVEMDSEFLLKLKLNIIHHQSIELRPLVLFQNIQKELQKNLGLLFIGNILVIKNINAVLGIGIEIQKLGKLRKYIIYLQKLKVKNILIINGLI